MLFLRKIKPIAIGIIAGIEALIVIFLLGLAFLTGWTNTTRDTKIVDPFGSTFLLTAETSKMEPTYGKNDILVLDKYGTDDIIAEGDIICFTRYYNGSFVLTTSRVENIVTSNNARLYTVKDDESEIASGILLNDDEIIGIYNGGRLLGLGVLVEGLASSSTVFFCSIVLPMIVFFLVDGFYIFWYIIDSSHRTDDDEDDEKKATDGNNRQ